MKFLPTALFALMVLLPIAGCGGAAEVPPPATAPEMTAEEKANYEKQMEMMMKQRQKK